MILMLKQGYNVINHILCFASLVGAVLLSCYFEYRVYFQLMYTELVLCWNISHCVEDIFLPDDNNSVCVLMADEQYSVGFAILLLI